jgi:hypothetical protein
MTVLDSLSFTPDPYAPKWAKTQKQFAEGIIRVRRLPDDWDEDEYAFWWLPEKNDEGRIVRAARMSAREKDSYTVYVAENQIMTAGRTQVLTYIGATTGNSTGFAKYLAIGTGAILAPNPANTSLATEVFRKAQASNTVQGTQVDINFALLSGDANITMTNCGLFGNAATGTLGSGTMYTQALFSYVKGAWTIAVDYLVNLL